VVDNPVQDAVADLVADQVAAGRHLGVQVAAWFDGAPVVDVAAGFLDPLRFRPTRSDSLFAAFSVTKAVGALAIWRMIGRGEVELDAPARWYWPALRADATLEQLLTHQAGLHHVPPDIDAALLADLDAGVAWVEQLDPAWPPGSDVGYHTLTFGWILEGLARRKVHMTLAGLVEAEVLRPLGIRSGLRLGLTPSAEREAAVVVERPEARGLGWIEEDGDHPARQAFPPTFQPDWNDDRLRRSGHGAFGAWATAATLAEVFARVGEIIRPDPLACLTRLVTDRVDRCLALPVRRGVGVELGGPDPDGRVGALGPRQSAFGHGGHGGQVVVADPEVGLSIAVLANLLPDPEEASDRTVTICELIRGLLGVAV
jgi:CubicO group peptidase (beta-lactamase class C family)